MRNKSDKDLWKQFENQQLKATYDISTHVLYSWISCMYTQVFTNWQMKINLNECFCLWKSCCIHFVLFITRASCSSFFASIFSYFIHICLFPFHSLNFFIWFHFFPLAGMIVSSSLVSVFSVLLVAIDRFLYISNGLKYQQYMFPNRVRFLIVISWIIGE